jgi:hypothetical protein
MASKEPHFFVELAGLRHRQLLGVPLEHRQRTIPNI